MGPGLSFKVLKGSLSKILQINNVVDSETRDTIC